MPRKRALTLGPPKKTSPSQPADPLSSSPPTPLPDTQIEALVQTSSEEEDEEPPPEAINYLIEYHFRYENDTLLQSSKAVDLRGPTPFFFRVTLNKGDTLAKEHAEKRGYALNKVHSKVLIKHGGMRSKDPPVTVNLADHKDWNNVEDILIQWADKQRVKKGITVSIDVLYARTMHGRPPPLNTVDDVTPVAVSPVKKKAVSPPINTTVQALIVVENHQFRYLSKHHGCQSHTGHSEGGWRRGYG